MAGSSSVVVAGVSKRYRLFHERNQSLKATIMRGRKASYEEFWALRDVSLEIPTGVTYGLIGENGSGKSTLLKCIARILQPDTGSVVVNGSLSALLELGAGFHPELSGRENVYLNGSILGLGRKQLEARFDDIVAFAGLEQFIDNPVKTYSSGMYVRLGFSVAINVDPDVLLVDEVLAVGDEQFQRRCAERFADLKHAGKTVVVVSHALGTVRSLCDEVALLNHGSLVATGPPDEVIDTYLDTMQATNVGPSDGYGRGAGDATVTAIEMLGPSGQARGTVRTGERCTVRVHYHAAEPVLRATVGLVFERVDGIIVAAPTTRDAAMVADRIEGTGHIDYVMDELALLPGTYDIGASLFDLELSRSFDQRTRILRVDVAPGHPLEFDGLVTLQGTWEGAGLTHRRTTTRSETA